MTDTAREMLVKALAPHESQRDLMGLVADQILRLHRHDLAEKLRAHGDTKVIAEESRITYQNADWLDGEWME